MRAARFLVAKFMGSAMHALAVTLENTKSSNELQGKNRRILLKTRTCCHSKMIAPQLQRTFGERGSSIVRNYDQHLTTCANNYRIAKERG
jgi:hypothetical protein